MPLQKNLSALLTPTEQAELLNLSTATHRDAFLGIDIDPDVCYTEPLPEEIPAPTDADMPPEYGAYGQPNAAPENWHDSDDLYAQSCEHTATLSQEEPIPAPTDEADAPDPVWLKMGRNGAEVDNELFAESFAAAHQLLYFGGRFYMGDEAVSDDDVKHAVYCAVKSYVSVSAQKINNLVSMLAIAQNQGKPTVDEHSIYFKNCTLRLVEKQGSEPHADAVVSQNPQGMAQTLTDSREGCLDGRIWNPPLQNSQTTEPRCRGRFHIVPCRGSQNPQITLTRTKAEPVCFCRVPHAFDPSVGEPTRLLAFLTELFEPEDIPTIQQYLGYCLLPSTKAQKALFIIGKGGEGKSRLTWLMQKVLGSACCVSSVARIGEQFFGVMLEHCLVYIDDDVSCEKFKATDTFKTLVTNEAEITVEPKGKAHYKAHIYAKFLLMGNQSVGSLHDRSEGFYRRVHIVNTKPRNPNRAHNPNIIQDIWAAEKAEILLWLVKGALQLARQNYQLSESAASNAALKELRRSDNTALEFLQEQNFVYDASYSVTSQQLISKYREWCYDNDMFKVGGQAFKQTCEQYFAEHGAEYRSKVGSGTERARGYAGVQYDFA